MIINQFEHRISHNCETGVLSNLLYNKGLDIHEDLIFGIGAGIYYIHFPFLKIENVPLTAYRYSPGSIVKAAAKSLQIPIEFVTYSNIDEAMNGLDHKIKEGHHVGVIGDLYYFEVFPEFLEMHFNGHNLVVYGKDEVENSYFVSDPIVDKPLKIHADKIRKARFTYGVDNPKGKMYWIKEIGNKNFDLEKPIKAGIQLTCKRMLNVFFPFGGVYGFQYFSKKIKKYPQQLSQEKAKDYLTHYIRLQELVGNQGSAFRLQYAGFLDKAADIVGNPTLKDLSKELLEDIAADWRTYSVDMARCQRTPLKEAQGLYDDLAEKISKIGLKEKLFFKSLKKANNQ